MIYVMHVRSVVLLLMPWLAVMAQDIAALEQQVQKYLAEQKPQLAIPVLREIVSLDARNLNSQANLGVLLFFQGDYAEAVPHMRAALQLQPDLWKVEALLGIAEKRTGNMNQAQADLEGAFSNLEDPKIRTDAGLELVEIYVAASQLDKALALAGKLQELSPQNPRIPLVTYEISRQMMYHSLLSMMMVAPDSAEMHMLMGGELGRQGDHANAIAQYREAIRLNPKLPGAHFELAEQLRTSSDAALNVLAEGEYKAALQVNAYDELSWRQLAGVLSAKGDYKTAEENYRKALALQPRDSEAKTGLAIVLISTNRASEAIVLLESAVKDDPTNMAAHYRLSILYRRAGRTADAEHELETFQHYKEVKDKLGKVFKQLAGPTGPM